MIPSNIIVCDYTGRQITNEDILVELETLKALVLDDDLCSKLRSDNGYLLRFLHASQYHVENAFEMLSKCAKIIKNNPHEFIHCSPKSYEEVLSDGFRMVLDERDNEGRRLFLFKLDHLSTSKHSPKNISDIENFWDEYLQTDIETLVNGVCMIIDCKHISMSLIKWVTPQNIGMFLRKFETAPMKNYRLHIINLSSVATLLFKMVWPFLPAEFKKCMMFHKNFKTFHQHVSEEVLPVEYGGAKTIDYQAMVQKLIDRSDEIEANTKYFHYVTSSE